MCFKAELISKVNNEAHVENISTDINNEAMSISKVCSEMYDKLDLLYGQFGMTLWGDKVSMLTHIYPHKPQKKIEVTICKITRLTAHFMCGLLFDVLICKFIKTYGHT